MTEQEELLSAFQDTIQKEQDENKKLREKITTLERRIDELEKENKRKQDIIDGGNVISDNGANLVSNDGDKNNAEDKEEDLDEDPMADRLKMLEGLVSRLAVNSSSKPKKSKKAKKTAL